MVRHPLLDTLGIDSLTREVTIIPGRVVVVGLATPSSESLRRARCPRADANAGPGMIIGRLRNADTDAPLSSAAVSLVYSELTISSATGVHRFPRVRRGAVGANGSYAICGLPVQMRGTLQATLRADSTADVEVTFAGAPLFLRSMSLGTEASALSTDVTAAPASGDATPAIAPLAALARLAGRVTDVKGAPVAGAHAMIAGVAPGVTTDDSGGFSLESRLAGTRELLVRKVGYTPTRITVDLTRREPRYVELVLATGGPTLSTVQVNARNAGLEKVGFYDRRTMGMGYYLTPSQIDSLHPKALSSLLNLAPGISVTTTDWGTVVQSTRSVAVQQSACVNVFVDYAPWSSAMAGDLDTAFPVADVAAIEVYGGTSVPSEFTIPGKSCATVVVWTRGSSRDNPGKP